MRFRAREKLDFRVEMSPLIDVVFILLIFFVVTTTFRADSGIEIDLPVSGSTAEQTEDPLEVVVAATGEVYVEGTRLDIERVAGEVRSTLRREPGRRVRVRADEGARHGTMVAVYEALREAGAAGFSIETRPAPAESP
jgi:biopolymer transport protein ExbD